MSSQLPTLQSAKHQTQPQPRSQSSKQSVLGRRKRPTLLIDLHDDLLLKIIYYALQMNPRFPGQVSRRVRPRFQTVGKVIAQISQRFNALLRRAVTSLDLTSRPPHVWLNAMLVFAQSSLVSLRLVIGDAIPSTCALHASRLCLMLARTHPPLRSLALSSLSPAPFEHVVSLFRALPHLREIDLTTPRPVDIAAITHACPSLRSLSLGPTAHHSQVDEIHRQFSKLLSSSTARSFTSLNIPWCCATLPVFKTIGKNCQKLERLAVEFGAMHWIRHRLYSRKCSQVDLDQCAREQRDLFRTMLRSVADCRLRSFAMRTLDGIPSPDLEMIFDILSGLTELDLFVGPPSSPKICPDRSFRKLTRSLATTLTKVNIIGMRFSPDQVAQFASEYSQLQTLRIWMSRNERPSIDVFSTLGQRIRHLSLLCDWDEHMCAAVGKHNTKLESLFLVTTHLPLKSISALLAGVRFTLHEFQLFFNRRDSQNDQDMPHPQSQDDRTETSVIVHDAARLVANGCAANLEVLNVSALPRSAHGLIDCTTIASELRRCAPHLYQICDAPVLE